MPLDLRLRDRHQWIPLSVCLCALRHFEFGPDLITSLQIFSITGFSLFAMLILFLTLECKGPNLVHFHVSEDASEQFEVRQIAFNACSTF